MRWGVTATVIGLGALGCTPDFDSLDPSLGGGAVGPGGASAMGASTSTGGSGTGAGTSTGGSVGTGGSTGTGGTATGDGTPGSLCNGDAACQSGFCVDGVCCKSACTELCAVCAGIGNDGTCGPAPKFQEEPGCETTEACGGGTIASCKGLPGTPCANNGQCLSSSCDTVCN